MRLILISPPQTIHQETHWVNQLFESGLDCFHLRKPESNRSELETFLHEINPMYHQMIVLHNHHELAEKYSLKGIHLREPDRKTFLAKSIAQRLDQIFYLEKQKARILSTSIHTISDLKQESNYFEYVFVSPVFESISKEGYKPQHEWDVRKIKTQIKPQLIALGGVGVDKISRAKSLGFDGVAVLGAVWQNEHKVLENFKIIRDKCQDLEQMY